MNIIFFILSLNSFSKNSLLTPNARALDSFTLGGGVEFIFNPITLNSKIKLLDDSHHYCRKIVNQ